MKQGYQGWAIAGRVSGGNC